MPEWNSSKIWGTRDHDTLRGEAHSPVPTYPLSHAPFPQRDCDYCQYHIQAQYKRLSAKRSDLQSSFSGGRVPKKFARGGASLKARLCQDGFYYGGVSSASYAAAL